MFGSKLGRTGKGARMEKAGHDEVSMSVLPFVFKCINLLGVAHVDAL
jgi:hypothetical protein